MSKILKLLRDLEPPPPSREKKDSSREEIAMAEAEPADATAGQSGAASPARPDAASPARPDAVPPDPGERPLEVAVTRPAEAGETRRRLLDLLMPDAPEETGSAERETRLLPIASGKGGVGKTNLSVNLSIALAEILRERTRDANVLLIDCDFGLPNADILLGASGSGGIQDFIMKRTDDLSRVVARTEIERLRFLPGAKNPSLTLGNLHYQQRRKFLRHLKRLKADYLILDLGASVHFEVLDFFSMVNSGIVVTNPEPTARRDSYIFIRNTLLRRLKQETRDLDLVPDLLNALDNGDPKVSTIPKILDILDKTGNAREARAVRDILGRFRPKVIVNRSESYSEGLDTVRIMRRQAESDLGIEVGYLGPVTDDPHVVQAVKAEVPVILKFPESQASHWIRNLAQRIMKNEEFEIERNYFSFTDYIRRIFRRGPSVAG